MFGAVYDGIPHALTVTRIAHFFLCSLATASGRMSQFVTIPLVILVLYVVRLIGAKLGERAATADEQAQKRLLEGSALNE